MKGDTDSERLFALITRETETHGGDVGRGNRGGVQVGGGEPAAARDQPDHRHRAEPVGAALPRTHELHLLERAPGVALEHESALGSRVHCEHGSSRPLVVIASEPMDADPGWRAVEPGELLCIDHDLGGQLSKDPRRPPGATPDAR